MDEQKELDTGTNEFSGFAPASLNELSDRSNQDSRGQTLV